MTDRYNTELNLYEDPSPRRAGDASKIQRKVVQSKRGGTHGQISEQRVKESEKMLDTELDP